MPSKAKGKEKEEKDSSKKIVKKENHFSPKGDIKRALLLKQSFYLLLSRETSLITATILTFETLLPKKVQEILYEFGDIFPKEILPRLPPLRGIEHQIDLVRGASLPNRPSYRTNPQETKEIES